MIRTTLAFALLCFATLTSCSSSNGGNLPRLIITGTSSVPENATDTSIVVQPSSGASVSLEGADAALFQVTSDGRLVFRNAPNFENPSDQNGDNIYSIVFRVTGGGGAVTYPLSVTVTDEAELPAGLRQLRLQNSAGSSQFFDFTLDNGQRYAVSGTRDGQGFPDAVDTVTVSNIQTTQAGFAGEDATVLTDANGRFRRFYLQDGEYVEFAYDAAGRIASISVRSADGSQQGIVTIDGAPTPGAAAPQAAATQAPANIRRGRRITARPLSTGSGCEAFGQAEVAQAPQSGTTPVDVMVRECGEPITDANIRVVRTDPSGLSPSYSAAHVGNGVYRAFVPSTSSNQIPFEEGCGRILETVNLACSAFADAEGFNPLIAQFVAAQCVRLIAPNLIAACIVAVEVAAGYCVYASLFGEAADPATALLCRAAQKYLDSLSAQSVTYYAVYYRPGGGQARSQSVTIPTGAPIPPFSIDTTDLSIPAITASTIPVDPSPGQDYDVLVSVSCRANSDSVQISVSGTDGYQDSTSCPLTNKQGGCRLSVPGGDTGVVDTITIRAGNETTVLRIVF